MHCTLPRSPRARPATPSPAGVAEDHAVATSSRRAGRTRSWRPSLGQAVEVGEEVELVLGRLRGRLRCGAADRRSAPWDEPSPGCRAAAHGRPGRSSPARPCRARRVAGRGRGCGARRRLGSGSAPPLRITDWYSAVGMFLRVASSCVSVSTIFLRLLLDVVLPSLSLLRLPAAVRRTSIIWLNSLSTFALKSASIW